MRERLLGEFDTVWIDNLNGDSRETGKTTPAGQPDPSVFSTAMNRAGIRVGTSVALMVCHRETLKATAVAYFREFWGATKREALLATLAEPSLTAGYSELKPTPREPIRIASLYVTPRAEAWVPLSSMCRVSPIPTLLEKRGAALFDLDNASLEKRMVSSFDPENSLEQLRVVVPGLTQRMDGKDPAQFGIAPSTSPKSVSNRKEWCLLPYGPLIPAGPTSRKPREFGTATGLSSNMCFRMQVVSY